MKMFLLCWFYSLKRLWALLKPTRIRWKKLNTEGKQPFRAYKTDSGFDLYAAERITILKGGHANVGSGLAIEVESGWGYSIRGRSGLNRKGILCALGLVDSFYRGEVRVVLSNLSANDFTIEVGDRVAQLHFHPVYDMPWEEVDEFKTRSGQRGEAGWGSSGA